MGDIRGPNGEAADEETIRQTITREGARPFDLAQGPLVRVHLIRVSEADYALLVNVHHIVTDGWSMPIVMREMDELYKAYVEGREPSCRRSPSSTPTTPCGNARSGADGGAAGLLADDAPRGAPGPTSTSPGTVPVPPCRRTRPGRDASA